MTSGQASADRLFHVWLVRDEGWRPECWSALPQAAVVIELAEDDLFSRAQEAIYVESFNQLILELDKRTWAVAVSLRHEVASGIKPGKLLRRDQMLALETSQAAAIDVRQQRKDR